MEIVAERRGMFLQQGQGANEQSPKADRDVEGKTHGHIDDTLVQVLSEEVPQFQDAGLSGGGTHVLLGDVGVCRAEARAEAHSHEGAQQKISEKFSKVSDDHVQGGCHRIEATTSADQEGLGPCAGEDPLRDGHQSASAHTNVRREDVYVTGVGGLSSTEVHTVVEDFAERNRVDGRAAGSGNITVLEAHSPTARIMIFEKDHLPRPRIFHATQGRPVGEKKTSGDDIIGIDSVPDTWRKRAYMLPAAGEWRKHQFSYGWHLKDREGQVAKRKIDDEAHKNSGNAKRQIASSELLPGTVAEADCSCSSAKRSSSDAPGEDDRSVPLRQTRDAGCTSPVSREGAGPVPSVMNFDTFECPQNSALGGQKVKGAGALYVEHKGSGSVPHVVMVEQLQSLQKSVSGGATWDEQVGQEDAWPVSRTCNVEGLQSSYLKKVDIAGNSGAGYDDAGSAPGTVNVEGMKLLQKRRTKGKSNVATGAALVKIPNGIAALQDAGSLQSDMSPFVGQV